ncbi:DUF599 domain-containing protein [Kordiimonas sp.]|uniref:DUF599 domain-containing protein n=1 Tax=Kordiimonas sp. TaxID=1970157 RepID=UPI003A8F5432
MHFYDYMSSADIAALVFFLILVSTYTLITDHSVLKAKSISAAIDRQREHWMEQARRRELRMLDSNILGVLVSGISIFASTNIFVIGGLIAGLAYNEELSAAFSSVPFADPISPGRWAIKLTLLLAIFVYAFFKFAWAIRLANYCAISVGAMSAPEDAETDVAAARAKAASKLAALCGHHFNRGLRANFYGLAVLGWFFSPWLFIAGTLFVVIILLRREFFSRALLAVKDTP